MKFIDLLRQGDLPAAIAFSVLAHLLVMGTVLFTWSSDPELTSVPEIPPHVQAVVMEKPAPKPQPKPAPKPKPKPEPKPKPKPKPEPKPDAVNKPAKPETTEKPVTPDFSQPDMAELLAREELEMADPAADKAADDEQQAAQDGDTSAEAEELGRYQAAIRNAIKLKWSRPPGARNEMQAVVQVNLIPGGEVVQVRVTESSGSSAFDRSAVAAVKNASPLPVPSGELFNEHFRSFKLRFNPEDLKL